MVRDALILLCALVALLAPTLGIREYATPSEARYIEVPRQMVVTGDWLTPRQNGVKYFDKPPLFYWVEAAQIEVFGAGEFSGRFWTMMSVVGICLTLYFAGAALYSRATGFLAALTLATSILGFALSRVVLLDAPVSLFLTICLLSFLFAIRAPPGRRRDVWLMAMYVAAAGAVMTKGLIGILLPGAVIGGWIVLTGNFKLLLGVRLISGTLVFLALTAPWHVLVGRVTPEFFDYYFIRQHFVRFLTAEYGHAEPWWWYLPILAGGLLPWTIFLPQAFMETVAGGWKNRANDPAPFFLLLWLGLFLLFFCTAESKLVSNILPVLPPIALIAGRYLARHWQDGADGRFRLIVGCLAAGMAITAMAMLFAWPKVSSAFPEILVMRTVWFAAAAIFCATSLIMGALVWRRSSGGAILAGLLVSSAILLNVQDIGVSRVISPRSIKPLARAIVKDGLRSSDEVASYRNYFADLPVYLNRNVTVVDAPDKELEFGASIEPATAAWVIHEREFWRRWNEPGHRMYAFTRVGTFQPASLPAGALLHVVAQTSRYVLVRNFE